MNTTTNQASGVAESDEERAKNGIHVCVRHDFTIVDDPKSGCPDCNAERAALATKPAAPAEVVATDFSTWFDENEHLMVGRGYTPRDIAMFGWHASLRTPTQAPSTGAVAWLRFWAWQGFGNAESGPDNETGYELCKPTDKGIDGSDAFPVYASPPVVQPASPAVEVASEPDTINDVLSREERTAMTNATTMYGHFQHHYRPKALARTADERDSVEGSMQELHDWFQALERIGQRIRIGRPPSVTIAELAKHDEAIAAASSTEPASPADEVARIVHLRTDREKRVYIAGPMTGLPEYNFPAFNAKASELRAEGWHVENPAEHGHVDGAGWADYLRWDISRIATCGAIYLLPGWEASKGACLEVHISKTLGINFMGATPTPAVAVPGSLTDAVERYGDACYAKALHEHGDWLHSETEPRVTADVVRDLKAELIALATTSTAAQPAPASPTAEQIQALALELFEQDVEDIEATLLRVFATAHAAAQPSSGV